MPTFDENLNPILRDQNIPSSEEIFVKAPKEAPAIPSIYSGRPLALPGLGNGGGGSIHDKIRRASEQSDFSGKGVFVSDADLAANVRYDAYNPTLEDQEDFYAQRQGVISKGVNGILKGTNLAATTIAGGFAMLGGLPYAAYTGKLSDIWDNPGMRALDDWNAKVDNEYLPNYYTQKETQAKWYDTNNWFTANFLFDKLIKNAGFAVGAMYSGNIMNGILKGAGAGLGAASLELATAAEASQAFKTFTPLLRNMSRGFSQAKNIEVANILEKELKSIADIEAASSRIAGLNKVTNQFASFGDEFRRTAVAAYSSAGEASFEALQTSKEYRNGLIEEYKKVHAGNEPTGSDLAAIEAKSESVGKVSFLGNMALLGATEYLQLPKLLGSSYAAEKQAANSLLGSVNDVVKQEGKYVTQESLQELTRFGKLYKGVGKKLNYVFDPKESGQELGQFALQIGTQNYFKKALETNDASVWVDGFIYGLVGKDEKTGEGKGALVSKEGIEGAFLGGITGGAMQALHTIGREKRLQTNTDNFIESLNYAPSFRDAFKDKMSYIDRANVLHQQQQQATVQGDELEARDLKADLIHTYLAPRIKYGRFDMIMEDIKELKAEGITSKGLADLKTQSMANSNDTIESFQKRLTEFETYAKNTEANYKAANLRYSGEIIKDEKGLPVLNMEGKPIRKYSPLVIDKMVYAESKIADYETRIPKLNSELTKYGVLTQEILDSIINEYNPNLEATEKALQTINSLDVLSDVKDELKIKLSDMIELSLRRQSFMQEYNDIKSKPLNYEEDAAYAPGARRELDVTVLQKEVPEGKKRAIAVEKPLEVGKQYSLKDSLISHKGELVLAPKMTVLSQTLGGEFEVRMPDGSVNFLTPSQFKDYILSEEDNRFEGIDEAFNKAYKTALEAPRFKEVKQLLEDQEFEDLESKLFYLKNLKNDSLNNAILKEFNRLAEDILREKKEKLAREELYRKKKDEWKTRQDALVLKSADTSGIDTSDVNNPGEDARKDSTILFKSSTTESEDLYDPTQSSPHIKRSREFLNNIDGLKNRGNIRAVLVHAGNAEALGLEGIVQMSYNVPLDTPIAEIQDATDTEKGFLSQVYIVQEKGKSYFIDKTGKKLTQVGKKVNLDEIVFQTMPTTNTNYSNGTPRYRSGQAQEANDESNAYSIFRKDLWKSEPSDFNIYEFTVSRGIGIENPGLREKNQVGGVLLSEDKIVSTEGLIQIPTTGTIAHNGSNLKFPNGVPVLKYGSTLTFLNNRLVTSEEAKALYKAIESVTSTITEQIEKNQPIRPESEEFTFIQNMLFWTKGEPKSPNQITIDEETMNLVIGNQSYSLTEISTREKDIVDQLKDAWLTVNNKTLKNSFRESFVEMYVDKSGELHQREWKNYQSFLLASKYPDGSSRNAESTPLTTSIAKPTDSIPYSFKQRYSTLQDLEFPTPVGKTPTTVTPAQPTPPGAGPLTIELDGVTHVIDGEHTNTFITKLGGPGKPVFAKFIAFKEGDDFRVSITGGNAIEVVANNRALDGPIKEVLTAAGQYDAELDEITLATLFLGNTISARLRAAQPVQSVPPVKPVQPTPSTPTVKPTKVDSDVLRQAAEIIVETQQGSASLLQRRLKIGYNLAGEIIDQLEELGIVGPFLGAKGREVFVGDLDKLDDILKGTKVVPDVKKVVTAKDIKAARGGKGPGGKNHFRVLGFDGKERITDLDLDFFEKWAAEHVSKIPYEVLENMVVTHDGRKAWGVFENGVAKFVKGGLRGTEYHEIGEAIWNGMLTPEEQEALLTEFKENPGTFVDRESGKKILHSSATDEQAKERILDNFADYRVGKLPAKSLGERIVKFFKRIIDFFKSIVLKPTLMDQFFKDIESKKYNEKELSGESTSLAPQYRAVEGLSEEVTHLFVEDMLARSAGILFSTDQKELLYSPKLISSEEIFEQIKEMYEEENLMDIISEEAWNELKIKTKDALGTRGISFETEQGSINGENANKNDYVKDTFAPEGKSNSSRAVKFETSTMIEREPLMQGKKSSFTLPAPKISNLGGYKLLNYNQAFSTKLAKFSNTYGIDKFIDKVVNLADNDSNYVSTFQKLGGDMNTKEIPFNDFDLVDWRFFIDNWQTFTKQKPEALIQYKEGTEVFTAAANLFDSVKQEKNKWIENMKVIAQSKTDLIQYDWQTKTYKIDEEELKKYPINNPTNMTKFLSAMGVEFPMSIYKKLASKDKDSFSKAVSAIHAYVGKNPNVMTISGKILDISGHLTTLAEMYTKVTNPNQDPTYYGVEGQRVGSYSENNFTSIFENEFNESDTLDELLEKRPELHDIFSENSQVLKKGGLFFNEEGDRIKEIKVKYIQGTKEIDDNNGITTSNLSLGDRFTQEINQNLKGNYYIIIPADGTTEWMMSLGNTIDFKLFDNKGSKKAITKILNTFSGYLSDDVKLALENRRTLKNVKNRATELRFFKDILSGEERYDAILDEINSMLNDGKSTFTDIENYITSNKETIDNSILDFIDNINNNTKEILLANTELLVAGENSYAYPSLDTNFTKEHNIKNSEISSEVLDNILMFVNANYVISNIEYHKVLFGDPFQFKESGGKLDETKRVKSFLSPRRTTFDSPEFNTFLNENLNNVEEVQLTEKDPGYTNFKSYSNVVVLKDNIVHGSLSSINKAYGNTDESDAFSWLMDNTYREIKLKNKQWSDKAEEWHQWQMAYTRLNLPNYKYTNEKLREKDIERVSTPAPKHKIEVLKPIITGNKNNSTIINNVLLKTAQMPIYYSMVEGTNMERLYTQMFNQQVGYAIVASGAKVGIEETHSLYTNMGSINPETFNNKLEVPWKAYGIQVETTQEGEKTQTRGSQLTKMSSMNLFDNGNVIGATPERQSYIKKEYENNKKLLDTMHENAYNELLNDLGIEDLGDNYIMNDGTQISETLMREMLRRVVSDNTKDTLELDENNQFKIPFEASPAYSQVRSILYSMVDKAIVSPKMHGGAHVQVPVTMFESAAKGRSLAIKTADGYKAISKAEFKALPEEDKSKVVLTDDTLKFYTKEDPYCEVMLPHWFKNSFPASKFPTQESILTYLNSKEGKEILTGIGFRIPTQSLSSVEVFRVKGFLPQYMGSTVVVPSEITSKAGSDFDIDKLNMYLKSIYVDAEGKVKLVRHHGNETNTKAFYAKVYDDVYKNKLERLTNNVDPKRLIDILTSIENIETDAEEKTEDDIQEALSEADFDFFIENRDVIEKIMDISYAKDIDAADYLYNLTNVDLNKKFKADFIKDMYKKSLENEYYSSLERLVTLPEVFSHLIKPVDDAGLAKIAKELNDLRGYDETKIKNRLLDRNYMTKLRHSFVIAKKWVGIAAVNITSLSLKQKSFVYIDPNKFGLLPHEDKKYLDNGIVQLKHNNVNGLISLSGTTVSDGSELISDRYSGYATAFVDVAKDPFIMDIIENDLTISIFMFLENIGVGTQSAFFLNQPIISEYVKTLSSKGVKDLYNKDNILAIRANFGISEELIGQRDGIFNQANLKSNIENYYKENKKDANTDEFKIEQSNILDEFLKYAKMSDNAFKFSQAINYDTTRVTNGDFFAKKQWETEIAEKQNIISSVNNVLNSTFIGRQERLLNKSMSAMGAVLKLENRNLRAITEKVLKPYGVQKYISADEFNRIANKIKSAFLDFVILNKSNINDEIYDLVVNNDTSVSGKLADLKQKYPEVAILRELEVVSGERPDGAKSIKLQVKPNDAYDENRYTGMLRELRDENPELNDFYKNLIKVSIIQGTSPSPISLRSVIPLEDYAGIVGPIMSQLVADPSLEIFAHGMFQKNQFKDNSIVPIVNPNFKKISDVSNEVDRYTNSIFYYKTNVFPNFDLRGIRASDRKILVLSERYNAAAVQHDIIKIPRVVTNKKTGEKVDMLTGKSITDTMYADLKKKGDYTLNDFFGYQKVKRITGEPLMTGDYFGNTQFVYKLVNLLGDGNRAVEYYPDNRKSVIDNASFKVESEMPDATIVELYGGETESDFDTSVPEEFDENDTEILELENRLRELEELKQIALQSDNNILVAEQLPKILPDSAKKETGAKTGTAKDINPSLLSNKGVTVEQAAHDIWENNFAENNLMDVQEIRDVIIDILTQGKNNFIDEISGQQEINSLKIRLSNLKNSGNLSHTINESNVPKGIEVKPGIFVNQAALSKEEQMELFNYLKPFLETQASKTNKGANASKMIGLGLRWDYKSNNPDLSSLDISDVISPANKTKYGYYNKSINGLPLGEITERFKELISKASGIDVTNYDGAIINLYDSTSFISAHNDVDESRSAINYPVIGINLGGDGNFSIESRDSKPEQLKLKPGSAYIFGHEGQNREVFHRTFPSPQKSFLPALKTNLDGKTYPAGSYRVTITMRRVMPLTGEMPSSPIIDTSLVYDPKYNVTKEEWDSLSEEEKRKIIEC